MNSLKSKYNIDIFGFQDELLFASKKQIQKFCEHIKKLNVNWYGDSRVNVVDKECIQLLKDSGCINISFGVESGSQKILKSMNKGTTLQQIERAIESCLDLDLTPGMGMILGYPGEDIHTIHETIDLFKKLGYPALKFRYITPYPGSTLYNDCIKDGTIKNEKEYLESLGDGTGPYKFRFNFTKFSDEQLTSLLPYVVNKIVKNYVFFLLKNPRRLFRYIFERSFMNPFCYFYYRIFHPNNYDKAAKLTKEVKKTIGELCQ